MKQFLQSYLRRFFLLLLVFVAVNSFAAHRDTLGGGTISFVQNMGQWNSQLLFKSTLKAGNLWLENNRITFDLNNPADIDAIADFKSEVGTYINEGKPIPSKIRKHAWQLQFVGCQTPTKVFGLAKQTDYENYFQGNDSTKWKSFVPKFEAVQYNNLYKGIDYKIYQHETFLKWDFIVHPGADFKQIKLRYDYVDEIKLISGNLLIKTSVNQIIELAPLVYQIDNKGNKKAIKARFKLEGKTLQFEILEDYNPELDLIIDPTLVFSTYSGSQVDNWGFTATYDSYGFLYAAGMVMISGYPTTFGAYDVSFNNGDCDMAITKFDSTGHFKIYSTYLGGNGSDLPSSLVVNSNDELFVLGISGSSNFPVLGNSFQTIFKGGTSFLITFVLGFNNGSDIVISRFNSAGSALLASTYFGGTANDGANISPILKKNYADEIRGEILIDQSDNCYIVSSTYSLNIPGSSNGFQSSSAGAQDGVIAKFDNNLSNLIYSSYIGGTGDDAIYSVALNTSDDLYITGGTASTDFPVTSGVFQQVYQGMTDGFVAKINKNGNLLMKSSYFGSLFYDQSFFIDVDRFDKVYLFGQTNDTNQIFHYNTTWFNPKGGQFVTKLKANLDTMEWSTIWGNGVFGTDVTPSAFMVDLCGKIYCSAWGGATNTFGTTSGLPVSPNAFQISTDGSDYYFLVLNSNANSINYATYFGGSISHEHVDGGTSRFDQKGFIYQAVCAGCGGTSDFPTTTGCNSSTNGSTNCNLGAIKYKFDVMVVVADFAKPLVGCAPFTTNFINKSYTTDSSLTNYHWDFGDGGTSALKNPTHTYAQGGSYWVTLIASNPNSCNLSDTIRKQITVLSGTKYPLPEKHECPNTTVQIGVSPSYDPSVSYLWAPGPGLSNLNIANPFVNPNATTTYTLYVTNGVCTDTILNKVNIYNITVNAGNDTTLCYANISLTASTQYHNLQYQWSSNAQFTDTLNSNMNDSIFNVFMTGPQKFYVKAYHGNCVDFDSVNVTVRIVIQNTVGITHPKCFGDSLGSISVVGGGGLAPYTYVWSNGTTGSTNSHLGGGVYTVTVTDSDGCFTTKSDSIAEPPELKSSRGVLNIPCEDKCIGKAYANPAGGTQPYVWAWDDAAAQTSNPAVNLCDGTYHVTITDANNCLTYDTVSILDSSLFMNFEASVNMNSIYEGQTVQLTSTNFGSNYMYQWTPADYLSNYGIYNPTATLFSTMFYVVEVHDAYGCTWRDSVYIEVKDVTCREPYIYIPNSFTPNDDGKNEKLFVRTNFAETLRFVIYDRWGEAVFETNSVDIGWDGTYKGKKCEPGVYVYYLELICYTKEKFEKKGNITLIR